MKQKKYRKSYERLFKKLPLGIREWAVIEFNRSDHALFYGKPETLADALDYGFYWHETELGFDFWDGVVFMRPSVGMMRSQLDWMRIKGERTKIGG